MWKTLGNMKKMKKMRRKDETEKTIVLSRKVKLKKRKSE
jgi:hypothetical protein